MAKLGINTGSAPNDGTGDSLLAAALKINQNFDEIYSTFGDGTNIVSSASYSDVSGISTYANSSGISSYADFSGISSYSSVSGVSTYAETSRIIITDSGIGIGTVGTIDFGDNLTVSPTSAGVSTVTGAPTYWESSVSGIHTLSNVGVGTADPTSALTVRGGDISVGVDTSHGVILTSPNGTQYRLIVDDSGNLSTVAV